MIMVEFIICDLIALVILGYILYRIYKNECIKENRKFIYIHPDSLKIMTYDEYREYKAEWIKTQKEQYRKDYDRLFKNAFWE